ncbi:hypothetical protein Ocin01_12813 [Orchesella cincta]|uniref:Uncharacterized protein n=1 Tax=Orchesella cincta TaxID=48709 RepID=A0A1D2MLD1_ORCCI|nr:hypothetical protein Ocin01_12813 [Orchesella cincta]
MKTNCKCVIALLSQSKGCNFKVTTKNPSEEDALENEVESQQSRVMIEQALQAMHLYETKGFYVKYSGLPCCPSLKISPSIMGSGLFSVSPTSWAIKASSNNYGCFCCFMPASWSWQTITLNLGEQEVLNFIYRPQIWSCFGTKDRIVDIYVPQRNERIGLLKYKGNLDDGTIITDAISRSLFLAAKIADHPTPGFKITDNIGIPVAVAQASRGLRYRGITTWTDFELQYAPLAANMPASSKAILAVGFLMGF